MIVGISGALSIIYCTIGLYILDKIGRVKPLIASAVGCGLSLLVNAILSQYYVAAAGTESANGNALRAMVAMNFVFSLFFTFIVSWKPSFLRLFSMSQMSFEKCAQKPCIYSRNPPLKNTNYHISNSGARESFHGFIQQRSFQLRSVPKETHSPLSRIGA